MFHQTNQEEEYFLHFIDQNYYEIDEHYHYMNFTYHY